MFGNQADLHIHSRKSDGSSGIETILNCAAKIGLKNLAITDHDTLAGISEAKKLGEKLGINVIEGVELSAKNPQNNRRVHILCYLPKNPEFLEEYFQNLSAKRQKAAEIMLEKLLKIYPVDINEIEKYASESSAIFKVHIMQALIDLGYDNKIYGELYKELFSRNSPKNIAQSVDYPSVDYALDCVKKARGVAVLAHPSVYDSMDLLEVLAKEHKIDGVEVFHPKNKADEQIKMLEIAEKYGLFVTGGTDFHGFFSSEKPNPLGTCTTNQENLSKLYQVSKNL